MRRGRTGARWAALAIASLFLGSSWAQNPAVAITVDANSNRHPINADIYGVAYASTAQLNDLNAPLNRYGGNASSRYNWQLNASNRGFDWYFESIAENSATAGELGDTFIASSRAGGSEPMITIPMLDWVAKLGPGRGKLASFSQSKYGAQTGNDWQWFADAGNGVLASTGQDVSGNDPNDANVPAGVNFQKSWVQHLTGRWGTVDNGGLRYYLLDNEPSIWQSSHRDVHPVGPTMDEMRQRMIDYAVMIRSVDPLATVVGPEEWGWSGYFYSGYDQQYGAAHGWCCYPDRAAHGNMDYVPWLLDQLHKYEVQNGKRLLDVFSLHYYPQGGEFSDDVSTAMQQQRSRSTRSLWDPNYVDASWIGDKIFLIPRMKGWLASYYPGLKAALTEYNFGAEGHINGATTQADVLGIFGREGLDIATRWTTPAASTPTYKAMKMYRNYDGGKSGFGDVSVSAGVPDPDNLAAYAALRSSDRKLTVMVIAKVLSGSTPVAVNLANYFATGAAQVWQLTSANVITRLADVAVAGNSIGMSVPAQSVTLLVVSGALPPNHLTGNTSTLSPSLPVIVNLAWRDGAAQIDVYRDGVFRTTVANRGFYSEKLGSNPQPSYVVCNSGTTVCSNAVKPAPHRWTRGRLDSAAVRHGDAIGRRLSGDATLPTR
jgi:hypothetical protein